MSTLRLLKYHDCEGKDFGEGYMRAGCVRFRFARQVCQRETDLPSLQRSRRL